VSLAELGGFTAIVGVIIDMKVEVLEDICRSDARGRLHEGVDGSAEASTHLGTCETENNRPHSHIR
jgi:hypothetical protein